MKKSIGQPLKFEELRTLLAEIEATLNNRPLKYVFDDESGASHSLTLADVIYGRQITVTACQRHYDVISTFRSLTKTARHHFRLREGFTKQWRREYLLGFRETHKTKHANRQLSVTVADVVILKEDASARCWRKLAMVTELLTSRVNVVSAAKIQLLKNGSQGRPVILRRAIQLLTTLEVGSSD